LEKGTKPAKGRPEKRKADGPTRRRGKKKNRFVGKIKEKKGGGGVQIQSAYVSETNCNSGRGILGKKKEKLGGKRGGPTESASLARKEGATKQGIGTDQRLSKTDAKKHMS